MTGTGPTGGPVRYRRRAEKHYDVEGLLVEFLINLLYAIAANLYVGSSESGGSFSGGQQTEV